MGSLSDSGSGGTVKAFPWIASRLRFSLRKNEGKTKDFRPWMTPGDAPCIPDAKKPPDEMPGGFLRFCVSAKEEAVSLPFW